MVTESFRNFNHNYKNSFMLSINIPIYNVEIYELVLQLIQQGRKLNVPFEIRLYDDGSNETIKIENREITEFPEVVYIELEKNVGRAAIRNKMGLDSKYEKLLFIDADSKVIHENYLENYLNRSNPKQVLCGGTAYQKEKPVETEKLLRWIYGTKREAVSAEIRNYKKGFIITSNNFLIEKQVFKEIHFRENIRNYGHEDTVLGYDLFKRGIEIFHINNPMEHTGLEDSELFIKKTKAALTNLYYISKEVLQNDEDFNEQVYFLNRFKRITRFIPASLFQFFYKTFRSVLEQNLKSKNPRMFWFDLFKLGYYSGLNK